MNFSVGKYYGVGFLLLYFGHLGIGGGARSTFWMLAMHDVVFNHL